jgi:hypothetical protein
MRTHPGAVIASGAKQSMPEAALDRVVTTLLAMTP